MQGALLVCFGLIDNDKRTREVHASVLESSSHPRSSASWRARLCELVCPQGARGPSPGALDSPIEELAGLLYHTPPIRQSRLGATGELFPTTCP